MGPLSQVESLLMNETAPDLSDIVRARVALGDDIIRTPVLRCTGLEEVLDNGTVVFGKLEFLQRTGTFKARGALATVQRLAPEQLAAGLTAVSAGNHAVATAFAAHTAGTHARVVMTASANACRVEAARGWGAEVVFAADVHAAFDIARQICEAEQRYLVHPFEGVGVALGTGTLGLEICEQVDDLDAIVVAVGGGGLIGGIANAVRQVAPQVEVIGVEPEGADSMSRSLASGRPEAIDAVRTIADSLGAPFAMPYSFELCRRFVSRTVRVSDDALRQAMGLLFRHMRIAVEPACAAATAALLGPLADELAGKRVLVLFCGSNIDWATYARDADL
jgi:threonine dehydratase